MLIEEELKSINGVQNARVNFKNGSAEIEADQPISDTCIANAVKNAGYNLGKPEKLPWFTKNEKVHQHVVASLCVLIIGFFVLNYFSVFNIQVSHQAASSSLPVVFIVGLTAGVSTCMALIGGLVLGLSSKFSQENRATSVLTKFRPHVMFNLGRIAAYFVLGGLLGFLGSFLTPSSIIIGALTILVAAVMLLLGLQLTEVSPRLATFKLTIPKAIANVLGIKQTQNKYSDGRATVLGALTFFLPCGFTQTMQLYALSIADPVRSAMIMGVFALGTTPGLLSIGGLTAIVKGTFAQAFFRFAGVLVIVLSLVNFRSALTLLGFSMPQVRGAQSVVQNSTPQYLQATYTLSDGLKPNKFEVQAGSPIQLAVEVKEDGVGCMSTMLIPGVANMPRYLKGGTTLTFEFTPQKSRNYNIVCAMGLPHGIIQAI
jgi:sulfite exporter TauE/SafE